MADDADAIAAVVQELLRAVPAGCTWLVPVHDPAGRVVDFRVAATSGAGSDLLGLGTKRTGRLLTQLYPTIAGGPLWSAYLGVLASGEPISLEDFQYTQDMAGIAADSSFVVSVHRVLDGLL